MEEKYCPPKEIYDLLPECIKKFLQEDINQLLQKYLTPLQEKFMKQLPHKFIKIILCEEIYKFLPEDIDKITYEIIIYKLHDYISRLRRRGIKKIESDFYNALYPIISQRMEEKGLEVEIVKEYGFTYILPPEEDIEIELKELMLIAREIINKNFDYYIIYFHKDLEGLKQKQKTNYTDYYKSYLKKYTNNDLKKQENEIKKANWVFPNLVDKRSCYPQGTIRNAFSTGIFNFGIIKAVFFDLLEMYNIFLTPIEEQYKPFKLNKKNIITETIRYHDEDIKEEYYSDLEEHYNKDEREDKEWKSNFITKYNKLSKKEKYILQHKLDDLINPFSFYNHIDESISLLNKKGKNVYNTIWRLLFSGKTIETMLSKYDGNNSDYTKIKGLIELRGSTIPDKDIEILHYNGAEEEMKKFSNTTQADYERAFSNLKMLFDGNENKIQTVLFLATFSEEEKSYLRKLISHLYTIPEYRE